MIHHWVLVGFWHGTPCAIQRGQYVPPFACWFRVPGEEWEHLRSEGHYTRRDKSRPTAFVDREDQRAAPYTVEETVA